MISSRGSPGTKLPASGAISSSGREFPRKRKGSGSEAPQSEIMTEKIVEKLSQNPFTYLLSTRIEISTPSGSREAHSQTEKRRRDKMNRLIEELSAMSPQHSLAARKVDKLSVLRRAVRHLRSLRGVTDSFLGDNYRPSFIQDNELRHLILKTAEGFLFVVGCERGRILFVSKSVSKVLPYDQAGLMGQNLFDFLHPKDVAKVKEQLSCDVSPREKLVDSKTGLQVHSLCHAGRPPAHSGSRGSFFFRMKSCKTSIKEEQSHSPCTKNDHRKFCTIHCTGYLRSWPPDVVGLDEERDSRRDSGHFTCLVAMGRSQPFTVPRKSGEVRVRPTEFITRLALNGKFVYVD